MSWLVRLGLRWRGRRLAQRFERACREPEVAQSRLLSKLLARHADTAFGREHDLSSVRGPKDFARAVPRRDYEALRPWIERLLAGEPRVLTAEEPFLFATTSGTTDRPKLVPVTAGWVRELRAIMHLWLYFAWRDHPTLLDGKSVTLVSPAVEGRTLNGTPIGSVSGLTYQRAPPFVRRTYAIPYDVSAIADYDHRYVVAARMMFAAEVSLVAAPNPSTLLRLAREGSQHGAEIVAAVHDGRLGPAPPRDVEGAREQAALYRRLEERLVPDRERARVLQRCLDEHGALLPRVVWPRLSLLGCWLGGSAGVQSRRLGEAYGDVPFRDLGLRATEATITIPIADGTPAGVLDPEANFCEFVPEAAVDEDPPPVLLAHQLEQGQRYEVLVTTRGGLYRYALRDVVEVTGSFARTPLLAFVRKGGDMVSLTGEKLHGAQVAEAAWRAARELGLPLVQVLLIPDVEAMRYDLLVELEGGLPGGTKGLVAAFDRHLADVNIEYRQKRRSRRLGAPRAWQMRPAWSERRRRADIEHLGRREAQYKWPFVQLAWDAATRAEVAVTPDPEDEST